MNRWKLSARCIATAALASVAATGAVAQKAAEQKPVATVQQSQPAQQSQSATSGNTLGYGVRMGGFFNDQHKQVVQRSFQQHYAKAKTCPKDMQREGKTCRALVKGSYWAVGQPVQKAVETHPLPDEVQARLPPAPQGYEYVRAGEDILLISKGMRLVVDMIQNAIS